MSVLYDETRKMFRLDTDHTSYVIAITEAGYAAHLYYGKRVSHFPDAKLLRQDEYPAPDVLPREKLTYLNALPFEYPTDGVGDFRPGALCVRNAKGQPGCELFYAFHTVTEGKEGLPGLPASFPGEEQGVESLSLVLTDPALSLTVTLLYSVFPKEDVITRSVMVRNDGESSLVLEKVLSASLDMDDRNFEAISLNGNWARERHICRRPVGFGQTIVRSIRGESSHQENPFLALCTPDTGEEQGEVYGLLLMYSGNHMESAEKNQFGFMRLSSGIHPDGFCWNLVPGETFAAPEVICTYSGEGLGRMTRNYHDFIREHVIRSPWKKKPRPVLINNWEATYFDFDGEKIYALAKEAKKSGIEMLVLDDGWFGHRNDDNSSLGDWKVNESKIGSLAELSRRIHGLGMKFGLWFEPEMISVDSDLYRAHPDWALQVEGRTPTLSRNQLVLDLSRKEVRDTVYGEIHSVLQNAEIDYIKWDMNRNLTNIGGIGTGREGQTELLHRYVLGVYEMQERLITDFPDLLLENCSGGGARFDAGMLYYSPQIWCSDDTDAIERLRIQEGTALVYPMSAMGAHVSKCPNEQIGRTTPFDTRANVALAGTFGYELNLADLPEEDRKKIPEQVERYHRYHALIADGDYYRLHTWTDAEPYDCWMNAAKDGSEALVTYVQVLGRPSTNSAKVFLRGLLPDARYEIQEECGTKAVHEYGSFQPLSEGWGDVLMNAGFPVPALGDFQSRLYALRKI